MPAVTGVGAKATPGTNVHKLARRFFTDKHGKIVLWQRPNVLLVCWAVSALLTKFLLTGDARTFVSHFGAVAIFLWAVFEIISGASPFRRVLGVVVLLLTVL